MVSMLLISVFVLGYVAITLEHNIKIDKAATALITGVLAWVVLVIGADSVYRLLPDEVILANGTNHGAVGFFVEQLQHHLGEIAAIIFFLLGAMTVVELIDAHDGFDLITNRITTVHQLKLLWIVCFISFFLSAVLDNLTTTIVMVSLLRKLIDDKQTRWLFVGMVIIAANAGGVWSPIGDVTTTMLWIGGQITASGIVFSLLLEGLVCILIPLAILSFIIKGTVKRPAVTTTTVDGIATSAMERNTVFFLGLGGLVFVPVFKTLTHLPPYMGMMLSLGVLWLVTEVLHRKKNQEDKAPLSVVGVIRKIDTPSVLFFLGILLAVAAMQSAGILSLLATFLKDTLNNVNLIALSIGLLSAIVDNVPLVAASIGMYPIEIAGSGSQWIQAFEQDGQFWQLLAYCAGTGGSVLIIGSAAGVAAMGLEHITFGWYLKRMSLLALLGYLGGAGVYMLKTALLG